MSIPIRQRNFVYHNTSDLLLISFFSLNPQSHTVHLLACGEEAAEETIMEFHHFLLSSVESSRCAASWQTRFWKLTLKSNKLVDLQNLYLNMVVFTLELLICWSWFRYVLENIDFQNFWKFHIFLLTHTVHLHACRLLFSGIKWHGLGVISLRIKKKYVFIFKLRSLKP